MSMRIRVSLVSLPQVQRKKVLKKCFGFYIPEAGKATQKGLTLQVNEAGIPLLPPGVLHPSPVPASLPWGPPARSFARAYPGFLLIPGPIHSFGIWDFCEAEPKAVT